MSVDFNQEENVRHYLNNLQVKVFQSQGCVYIQNLYSLNML